MPEKRNEPEEDFSEVYEELLYLCEGVDQESRDYLTGPSRGLTEETINRFMLFTVKDYGKADKHLKEKFSPEVLRRSGIVGEKGNLLFYKHKLIIPFTSGSKITFLQGRRLDPGEPKYLHIGRPVPLFNADRLASLEKGDKVNICEGVFDAMILEQNGFNAVAILGAKNFKPEMADLFKGLKVTLCLDNDKAGKEGAEDLAKALADKGIPCLIKELPEGIKDMTDYFLK